MKYYSEITKKNYNSEKECLEAEKQYALKSNEESKKQTQLSIRKKQLAKAIEEADEKVTQANKEYEIAKAEAKKVAEEADKKIDEIFTNAENKIKEAESSKFKLIQKWNEEFGTYNKTYTGKKALEEYEKAINRFNNLFKFFWF